MALIKLGKLLSPSEEKNTNGKFTLENVKGISIQKCFIETKADMDGVSLKPYKLVKPDYFAYVTVTSRNGEKITIAYNDSEETFICSSSYVVFYISKPEELNSEYLFMYFNRPEFDRYARFNSWGSARETFTWEDFCDIEIDLPDIKVQEKYVAIYKAMVANQKAYENGLDDLKLTCDAYIENLRREMPSEAIGKYIEPVKNKNIKGEVKLVKGVESDGRFMDTKAKMQGIDIKNYKIVRINEFAYNPSRINLGSIALCKETCIVSPMYEVFKVINVKKMLPNYLAIVGCKTFQNIIFMLLSVGTHLI